MAEFNKFLRSFLKGFINPWGIFFKIRKERKLRDEKFEKEMAQVQIWNKKGIDFWRCDSCLQLRPDDKIEVLTFGWNNWTRNYKYCNDKIRCFKKALADEEAEYVKSGRSYEEK